jgi:hypothetical protein
VASYPAGVLAFKFSASQAGKLNMAGANAITLKSNGGIGFTAEARVVSDGGASVMVPGLAHDCLTID